MNDFFYADDLGNMRGPCTIDEILRLIDRGDITSTTEMQRGDIGPCPASVVVGESAFHSEKPQKMKNKSIASHGRPASNQVQNFGMIMIAAGSLVFAFWSMLPGLICLGFGGVIWAIGSTR